MGVTVLVCPCGMRLKAPGAVPGRVGKCPACGGMLRVPEAPADRPPSPSPPRPADGSEAEPIRAAAGYVVEQPRKRPAAVVPAPPSPPAPNPPARSIRPATRLEDRSGLIQAPKASRPGVLDNLLYPLWGWPGIALVGIFPPLLWLVTLPAAGMAAVLFGAENPYRVPAMVLLIPSGGIAAVMLALAVHFLGRVASVSALGEVHHPHQPGWNAEELSQSARLWASALVSTLVVAGAPIAAYAVYQGTSEPVDRILLGLMAFAGFAYAQVALLAVLVQDSPWAANPFTVIAGLAVVHISLLRPVIVGGLVILAAGGLAVASARVENPAAAAVLVYLGWVVALYGAAVTMRLLGLVHHRHRKPLGWYVHRPRWGASI